MHKSMLAQQHISKRVLFGIGSLFFVTLVMGCPIIVPESWVLSTNPEDNAMDVPVDTQIVVSFSSPINMVDGDPQLAFTLKKGASQVAGSIAFSDDYKTAVFTPDQRLDYSSIYTAFVTTEVDEAKIGLRPPAFLPPVNDPVSPPETPTPPAIRLHRHKEYTWSFTTTRGVPPAVFSTIPQDGAVDVDVNTRLYVIFDQKMNPDTLTTDSIQVWKVIPEEQEEKSDTLEPVPGDVEVHQSNLVAIFTPEEQVWDPDSVYLATVTTDAQSNAGLPLEEDYIWSFITTDTIDKTPPEVIATSPAADAIDVPVDASIRATFSKAMNPNSINTDTFTLWEVLLDEETKALVGFLKVDGNIRVDGDVSLNEVGKVATFDPQDNLKPTSLYNAVIGTGVEDLSGNHLTEEYAWLFTTGTPGTVDVPDVVGLDEEDAITALGDSGLKVGDIEYQESDAPEGQVIAQDPEAGTEVFVGSAVDLVVSAGPAPIEVPDVVGKTQEEAETDIEEAGLAIGTVTTQNHETVPAGQVISQNPDAGTFVAPGSEVDLVISLGPVPMPVPDVVGLAEHVAVAAIFHSGFAVGTVSGAYSPTVPAGHVISQNPAAGALVAPGSAVDIVVSIGEGPGGTGITATHPWHGQINVPTNIQEVWAQFVHDIDASTVNQDTFFLYRYNNATTASAIAVAAAQYQYESGNTSASQGNRANFKPDNNLQPLNLYFVTITTGVKDKEGNDILDDDFTFNFTTGN